MWKASIANNVDIKPTEDDDWETDPDFINDVDEQEQRWGSKTIEGSGRQVGAIDMAKLRQETEQAEADRKRKELEEGPNPSFGYGGKFGVEADRMDQSAVGHDYVAKVEKHVSQKDYSAGFGGKFGVQTDRIDKSAVNWDYKEKIEKHASQKDYSAGFGGKFGVQADRQDKSAVGWDHVEQVGKHESQKDYKTGFGGQFGVQSDRQDKSAVGWDHHENLHKHESQVDHKKGFGGKFGIQTDRMDKSAATFTDEPTKVGTTYTKTKPDIGGAKPSDLRAKFENMSRAESSETITKSPEKKVVKQLDASKTSMFLNKTPTTNVEKTETMNKKTIIEKTSEQITSNVVESSKNIEKVIESSKTVEEVAEQPPETDETSNSLLKDDLTSVQTASNEPVKIQANSETEEAGGDEVTELEDTGLVAIALYDYQSAADDEISFDPEDIITHIEMIDEGWWRGLCRGRYGLFPANYVQLQQ